MDKSEPTSLMEYENPDSQPRRELERFARHLTSNNITLADDLIHDALLTVWRHSHEGQISIQNIEAYLKTAIKNRYFDHLRRERSKPQVQSIEAEAFSSHPLMDFLASETEGVFNAVWESQVQDWLNNALTDLQQTHPHEADAFRRHFFFGWNFEEIAQKHGVAMTTAYRRVERAKKLLTQKASEWLNRTEEPT
jgi:RNA polymerase sigma factor (sigma-70 family)